jgi:hypothetical protein
MDQNTTQPKQQVVDRLKQANNVLVTVSKDPSVDQLSACIGLSLALNKLGKHATAVYSGETPSTIEFLKPEETIEKNTDSLRDFIISLDKAKADKLRYKVEDQVVRIFITPYKTSITDQDLEFSQGDFNVDVVLAIGVHAQEDLDQAITTHGRILHDATVVTMNTVAGGELGSINWVASSASSLAEMASVVATDLGKDLLDEQISTALLTGIVAETDRFRNEKTSAETMNVSAKLMSAGANQQLVADQLEPVAPEQPQPIEVIPATEEPAPEVPAEDSQAGDGTLEIEHPESETEAPTPEEPTVETPVAPLPPEPAVDPVEPLGPPPAEEVQAPTVEYDDPAASQPKVALHNDSYQNPRQSVQTSDTAPAFTSAVAPAAPEPTVAPSVDLPPVSLESSNTAPERETLQDIEKKVNSAHLNVVSPSNEAPAPEAHETHAPEELDLAQLQRPEGIDEEGEKPDVDAAREAVEQAMAAASTPPAPEPIAALNAQPLGDPIHETSTAPTVPEFHASSSFTPEETMTMPLPPTIPALPSEPQENTDEPKAPSVPPPILPPPFGQN